MKEKAVLCDIHSTLLDDGKPIQPMIDMVNTLSVDYEICLITAEKLTHRTHEDLVKLLKKNGVKFFGIYHSTIESDDDVEIKENIFKKISPAFEFAFAIDNKKSVCKMYKKHNVMALRIYR